MSILSYISMGAGSILALSFAVSSLNPLSKNESKVITGMFGAPKGVLDKPGPNITLPWPLTQTYANVSLKKHIMHDDLYAKTSNNVPLLIPIDTEFRVVDPEKYAYSSEDPIEIVKQKVSRAVKSEVNELEYDDVASEKEEIMTRVKAALDDELSNEYGIELIDVMVDEPKPDAKIEEALTRREAAKLAQDAGVREGNAESLRIVELAKGLVIGSMQLNGEKSDDGSKQIELTDGACVKAGFRNAAEVVQLAQRHIALSDASGRQGNVVMDLKGAHDYGVGLYASQQPAVNPGVPPAPEPAVA